MTCLRFGLGCAAADEEIGVAHADGGLGKAWGDGGPGGEVGRKLDLRGVVQIEEALRRGGWAVGLGEAAADEEGLWCPCALAQELRWRGRRPCNRLRLRRCLRGRGSGRSGRRARCRRGARGGRRWAWGCGACGMFMGLPALRRVHGLDVAVEVGPGFVVVEAGVEELAAAQGGVAVFAEELWERDPVRMEVADAGAVAENLGGVGRMAGEERRARRIAERELAVVAVEANALGGESVDVGTVRVEAAVVAGELGAHVVGHEEEDVEGALAGVSGGGFDWRSRCRGLGRGGKCCSECGSGGFGEEVSSGGDGSGLLIVFRNAHRRCSLGGIISVMV